MTHILHVSAECYPIAKVGGLADVVGALPKYQANLGFTSNVIMPYYSNAFTKENTFKEIYTKPIILGKEKIDCRILQLTNNPLGFELFCVDIPNLLYKDYVYSYNDTERFLAFQIGVLNWVLSLDDKPDCIHVHDHHTGLIPFMLSHSSAYSSLKETPTVLTIHNAQYQGWFSHDLVDLIPSFDKKKIGLLDWDNNINPLACAIKCAWKVTTVSPSYMIELQQKANGLENLLASERAKCIGILNGIDEHVWNPETDGYLVKNYTKSTLISGKKANKKWLCEQFNLNPKKPLFAFIGRLVGEKGTDLFPETFKNALQENDISILLLGSGHTETEKELIALKTTDNYNAFIGYDEKLSHLIYAGADFLLMPSRVEPCGLNQMYALRYGTVPIVHKIGGLKDTVIDIDENGFGICHDEVTVTSILEAIQKASAFYNDKKIFRKNAKRIMDINHSWNYAAQEYLNLYESLNP